MTKEYVVNLRNPKDSPEEIAEKLNTLAYALDASVIRGIVTRDDFEELQGKTYKYINSNRERIDNSDLRWHGSGMSRVTHDDTLEGDGTIESPLSVVGGGFNVMIPTGDVDGVNTIFTFATAPSVIVVDEGRTMVQVSKNGNINWTGTTVVTLQIAPTIDIFGY